jgi:hypothetical protein
MELGDDDLLLNVIIVQNRKIIEANDQCEVCGNSADPDTRFKAQDRILKALALKKKSGKKSGSKFDLGDEEDE